jgi:hypothetical protein
VRSPVAVGIVLGVVVGGVAVAGLAATSSDERTPARAPAPVALPPESDNPAPGRIENVAAAFDMHAPAVTDSGGWIVRDGNRVLRVQRAAGLPWFFSTTASACVLVPEGQPLQTVPPSGPADCPEETAPGDVVSQDDALSLGTDILRRAGLGASTTDIQDEPGGWYIQATPRPGANPTGGLPWTISIGPGRTIGAASGYLAVESR